MYAKNAWNKYNNYDDIFSFGNEYKEFITKGKTERTFIKKTIALAKEYGFKDIKEFDIFKTR